ncbi:MAG: hypothetical protein Q9225_004223 [Loekoesia sp. 1 TL-2023]
MDGLSVAASVAGVVSLGIQVTRSLVDFYSAYKNQKFDIAYTIKKLEHLLGVLEILRNQTADRTFLADEQDLPKNIEGSIQVCEEYIRDLQSETEKFRGESTQGIRAAARTAAYKVAYPFRQSTLQKLDENIDEIVSHLSLALHLLGQKDICKVRNNVEDTKALLDLVRADQISSKIRQWLKAPDATTNYNESYQKRHGCTGLWLVEGSSFFAWLIKPNSFLWLNGFAGCGKSVLCSLAIQNTFRQRRSNPRIGIAFFFFTFSDDAKQDCSAMLRALVLQLSGQLNDNHGLLSQLYDRYLNAIPPDQDLMGCLRQLMLAFDDVYIILDALDESPQGKFRRDMLQALVDLRAWSEPGLHLLVTSREEPDICDVLVDELGAFRDETISMKNDSVDSDIASFISGSLKKDRRLRKWEKYHDQIEKSLNERAKGVSKRQLDTLLASLPQSLEKTYEQILLNIREESVEDARRILTLLCCAKRPLTIPEIIEGIAVELGDNPRLNIDGRLEDEDDVHRICPGLIETDFHPDNNEPTLRIAHSSVQEYLESERIHQHAVAAFGVRRLEAHAEIACICLTYLLRLASTLSISEYPLALYAAQNWWRHYHDGDQNLYRVEHQTIRLFRSTGGEFEKWVQIWNIDGSHDRDYQKRRGKVPTPIYYASLLGLDSIVFELLHEKPSTGLFSGRVSDLVNEQDGYCGNALQAASAGGHEKTVLLLLEKGADINAQGGYFGNTLYAASVRGHEKTVQLLLEKGADISLENGPYFGNALRGASVGGYEKTVQLLLKTGIDVNVQGGCEFGNALQVASAGGHEKTVQLLLENGADVNIQGNYHFGNALRAASAGGHEKTVQLLLEKEADISMTNSYGRTALSYAAGQANVSVVKLLLAESRTQASLGDNLHRPPVFYAAQAGQHKMLQFLLAESRTDPNHRDYYGSTLLSVAVRNGHIESVEYLLSIPDINASVEDNFGRTPLSWAVKMGNPSLVKLLTEVGGVKSLPIENDSFLFNEVFGPMVSVFAPTALRLALIVWIFVIEWTSSRRQYTIDLASGLVEIFPAAQEVQRELYSV